MALAAIHTPAQAVDAEIRPVSSTREEASLPAFCPSGSAQVEARQFEVDIRFPSGNTKKGVFWVAFDPIGRRYLHFLNWWRVGTPPRPSLRDLPRGQAIYADTDRILLFLAGGGTSLTVYEGDGRADSIDDAEARALRASLPQVRSETQYSEMPAKATANFFDSFCRDPAGIHLSASYTCPTTIQSVTHVKGGWSVVLVAAITAEVHLSADLQYEGFSVLEK
jgi:hypothetical protein